MTFNCQGTMHELYLWERHWSAVSVRLCVRHLSCMVRQLRRCEWLQPLGAVELAEGLVNNVSLHILNLAWNGLENVGCTAIAQALHKNMGLQVGQPSGGFGTPIWGLFPQDGSHLI